MAATIDLLEPGIFWRLNKMGQRGRFLSISYERNGHTVIESAKTPSIIEARKLRAQRIAAAATGVPIPDAATVGDLLDRLLAAYEADDAASLRTARGHVAAIRPVLGKMQARTVTSDHIIAMQDKWIATGTVTKTTINLRCGTLRRAFNLAVQKRTLAYSPWVRRLKGHKAIRGKYLPGSDHAALAEHLPDYVAILLDFARLYGVRKGQLTQTLRAWVDRERRLLEWPPDTCKNDKLHTIPLDGAGLAIIDKLLAAGAERPWCPYLFHGRYCAPGRKPNTRYGCVGDFKKAWAKACKKAKLPVGRKNGGYIFHNTRNTAVTDLLATGQLSEAETMVLSAHKTTSMIRLYNCGNVEALREKLERARAEIARLQGVAGE